MKFSQAIVRTPCKNIVHGLTEADLGIPDFNKALEQHAEYVSVLKRCGLEITVLEQDELFPDSTFVEDTAIVTPQFAVITNPGADSRRGEITAVQKTLDKLFVNVDKIDPPGTLDGGDVMMVGTHFYIGLSQRTNKAGADQLIRILENNFLFGSTIALRDLLHLKSGVSYLKKNNLVISGELIGNHEFKKFNQIRVEPEESYAANCLWINNYVLVAKGFQKTKKAVESKGYEIIELDMSEFRKIDGGLSCLSLRF